MKTYQFKPYNVGRWIIWSFFAIVLIFAPLIFTSNLSGTMLAQMGIAIIACLSYNILLGQGGMLSFGHAVYTGLGSFVAIHALNAVTAGTFNRPVSLLPLVGGFAGIGFAVLFGYVTTKKSGTPFAMITHVLRIFWWRGWRVWQSSSRTSILGYYIWSSNPSLLFDSHLHLHLCCAHVCIHPNTVGQNFECGAR